MVFDRLLHGDVVCSGGAAWQDHRRFWRAEWALPIDGDADTGIFAFMRVGRPWRDKYTVQVQWRNQPIVRLDVGTKVHRGLAGTIAGPVHVQWVTLPGDQGHASKLKAAIDAPDCLFHLSLTPGVAAGQYREAFTGVLTICSVDYGGLTWVDPPLEGQQLQAFT